MLFVLMNYNIKKYQLIIIKVQQNSKIVNFFTNFIMNPSNRYPRAYISSNIYDDPIKYTSPIQPHPAQEYLHYNNMIIQNQQLREDNEVLLMKLQKYQKLQPYINSLIARNAELQGQIQKLTTQNVYLSKNVKELHVQNKNIEVLCQNRIKQIQQGTLQQNRTLQNVFETRIKQLHDQANSQSKSIENIYQNRIKQLQELIQVGKDNGNKIRLENQNLSNKIKMHISEIEQYKKKLQEAITQKIEQEQIIKQMRSEKEKLVAQIKQLQNYNKQIVKNSKINQDGYLQKLQQRQRTIKSLQKDKQQMNSNLQKLKQQIAKEQINSKNMEEKYKILTKNHEALLNDYRVISLKKAELEQFLEDSIDKIERRQHQLSEIQMFREEQRQKYTQQLMRMQMIFTQQKSEYEQAIHHKSLKNQKLMQAYNELMVTIEENQKQIWQLETANQQRAKQNTQFYYQIESLQKDIQKYQQQLDKCKNKQQKMMQNLHSIQQEKYRVSNLMEIYQKQFQMRQQQFEEYVRNLRIKYQLEKQKWSHLYEEQKTKIRMTHEYDRKELESYLNKKITLLQNEVEEYRGRLNRVEQEKIQTEKQIIQTRTLLNMNARSQRRSAENSREKDRILFSSASKTARNYNIM